MNEEARVFGEESDEHAIDTPNNWDQQTIEGELVSIESQKAENLYLISKAIDRLALAVESLAYNQSPN